MVKKQSAMKSTAKRVGAEASTLEAPISIPLNINPKHPHFWKMNFLPERGYQMKDAHPSFEATVQALNWEGLVQHRTYYLEQIVREFYAGMLTSAGEILPDHSVVRGTKVQFDEQTINEHYHLRYSGNSFYEKLESYGKKRMEQIKTRIAVPNAKWDRFSHNECKMKIRYIIPELSNWHNFINCSIMPTSHNYTLSKDRLIVLDSILAEEEINIGRIINKEIRDCAKKKEGFLFFPCLITALCIKQRVPISEAERNQRKNPPNPLSAEMKARKVFKDPEELRGKKKEKVQEQEEYKHKELEQEEEKEQIMLRFFYNQHEWIKKRFEEISQAPSALEIPEFPRGIIKGKEKEKESEKEESEEEEVIEKKKSLKRKKETKTKGKGKKKVTEEPEWIELEDTEEEEGPELKGMEKDTEEEEENTTTEGSDKAEMNDSDLDLTMEEILRKKKAKSPVLEQLSPSKQPPTKSPSPSPATSTPPSTGTTPPPPSKITQEKADTTQKEKEPKISSDKEQTPTIDQPKEKTPPTDEPTPIIANIVSEMQDLNESQAAKTAEELQPERKEADTEAGASAPSAPAPDQQPNIVETIVAGDIEATLNVVMAELAEKKRQELGNTQKFFKKTTGAVSATETKQQEEGESVKEKAMEEEPKAKEASQPTSEEVEATLKDVVEALKDLPETVLEQPAQQSEEAAMQSGAQAPSASTPETAALKPTASGSKSKEKKQQKPKQTPTRSSSRIRSGAKPQ